MNQGNPFKLKALVDKWPDFTTVVIRPQEEVRCQMWNEYIFVFLFAMCLPSTWQCGRPRGYRNELCDGEQVPVLKKLTAWRKR